MFVAKHFYLSQSYTIFFGVAVSQSLIYPSFFSILFCVPNSDEIFDNITSSTVWYTMVGTGAITQLSLFADFDSKISIYSGDSCEELDCVNSNDDSPIVGPRSVIAQPMDEGVNYYILVHGFGRKSGSFTLESEVLEPAANDECSGAIPLELGVNASSSTLAATADEGLPFCGM